MRNNDDRLGTNEEHSTPLAPLEFVVPTSFVKLPSGGKFYPEGHPLCNQDTVEIKEMTAKEEDILSSRALIEKGVAVDRLVDSLLMDKRIKCDSLVVGDKNAIIVQARISAYGSDYQAARKKVKRKNLLLLIFSMLSLFPSQVTQTRRR